MSVLLIAEHSGSALKDSTHKALTVAARLGGEVHVLVAGANCRGAAEHAAKLSGVTKVLLADHASLAHQLAEPMAALIVGLAGPYGGIVAPASTTGKNVMPRVAALLDVMQVSDVVAVHGPDTFDRPIYAGNAIQTVTSTDAKKVVTVRTASFPAAPEGGAAAIETIAVGPIPACRASSARSSRPPIGRNCSPRRSSSRAAARSARRRSSAR